METTKPGIEDLLKPRYRVIADYPGSQFKVGQIIQKQKYMNGKMYVKSFLSDPDDYPAIFKKLQWWEERKPEEMPEYVKEASGDIDKVTWKGNNDGGITMNDGKDEQFVCDNVMCFYEPSTEQEYLTYTSQP